jgi:hypothetical protein
VTARSNESLKENRTGEQLFWEIILNTERNFAKRLGNSERLQEWSKAEFFGAARREWLDAWKRFAVRHGLEPLFDIRAGVQETLGPAKDVALMMLRRANNPEVTLRNQKGVFYACEGDVEFQKRKKLALRSRRRRVESDTSFLSYNILCYWFAGLLWLMSEKQGWGALCHYTKRAITKAAYRSACRRLGLEGYKGRTRRTPVLEYEAVRGIYKYR